MKTAAAIIILSVFLSSTMVIVRSYTLNILGTTFNSPNSSIISIQGLINAMQYLYPIAYNGLITSLTDPATAWSNFNYQTGIVQCAGAGPVTGQNGTIIGNSSVSGGPANLIPASMVNFGGWYGCNQTCKGSCVPNDNNPNDQPFSLYPWACDCPSDGCDANGPIGKAFAGIFSTKCDLDGACGCKNMTSPASNYTGYLCNWITIQNETVNYLVFDQTQVQFKLTTVYPSVYSPIRWCDCCLKT